MIVDNSHGRFLDRSRIKNVSNRTCRGSLLRRGRNLHELTILQQIVLLISRDLWTRGVGIRALSTFLLLWCWRRPWLPVVTVIPSVDYCNCLSRTCDLAPSQLNSTRSLRHGPLADKLVGLLSSCVSAFPASSAGTSSHMGVGGKLRQTQSAAAQRGAAPRGL